MASVTFTRNLQRLLPCPPAEAQGTTVKEVLEGVFDSNPRARGYVLDDQGSLRRHMVVFINGEPVRDRMSLTDAVPTGAEIYVMQALSGG